MNAQLPVIRTTALTAFICACVLASASPSDEGSTAPFARDLLEDRAAVDEELKWRQQSPRLWIERAEIQGELLLWEGAFRDLTRALEAGADPYSIECARARFHGAMGVGELSEEAANRALKLQPNGLEARVLRAEASLLEGRFIEAADDFGRALESVPYRPLDLAYAQAGALAQSEGGARGALAILTKEIEERGELPSLMLRALDHERALGLHDAALKRLGRLAAGGWSPARALRLTGDILGERGDRAGALGAWRAALAELDGRPLRRRTTRAALRLRRALVDQIQGAK